MAAHNIPHEDKEHYGGEDAYFYSAVSNSFGVADGVGGWGQNGVNPADYSRLFVRIAMAYLDGDVPKLPEYPQHDVLVSQLVGTLLLAHFSVSIVFIGIDSTQ